jgi:hypothetical protein
VNHIDVDLVRRSLATAGEEADEKETARRKARFEASIAALEADPEERARIDSIAASVGLEPAESSDDADNAQAAHQTAWKRTLHRLRRVRRLPHQPPTANQAHFDLDADLAEIIGDYASPAPRPTRPPRRRPRTSQPRRPARARRMTKPETTRPVGHWEPALAPREAAMLEIPRREYESAVLFARMAIEEHKQLGTARDQWEPTRILNHHLADPFITDGEQELASRLEKEADLVLDRAQDLIEDVKGYLDEIATDARPISTPESGSNYSVAAAVERVGEHDVTIERDEAYGKHHHRRASTLLQRLATWAPWLEAVGFLTFVTYYLNVPLLEPWRDWLGWSFAMVVVVGIILGQTCLARQAAKSHNHAREDHVDGHRHEAGQGFRKRNWYLAETAVTAVTVTGGMIWRGTATLANASIGVTALIIFAATVTGLLLPTLAYLGIALDGSKISRERDSLAANLDDDLDDYLEIISDSRRSLAGVAEIGDTLRNKTFPDICHAAQETVDDVYGFYSTVRLLIGGLAADPPPKTSKSVERGGARDISGYIGTSIPGAGTVNLDPLFDRQRRLDEIEAQRASLLNRIVALPTHPWGKSHRAWPHDDAKISAAQTAVN